MSRTYLAQNLKEDRLCRWPDGGMPILVYIAPFVWYEKQKQQQAVLYRQLVLDALQAWRVASQDLLRFQLVNSVNDSQIDIKWRRVDRRTLGHCNFEIDGQSRMFSAAIQVGISDGLVHAAYQHLDEVRHTILHELGHALGLVGHSDQSEDIMYVPHQYGVHTLSPRDGETISWLYRLPVGFDYRQIGKKYHLSGAFDINQVIEKIEGRLQGGSDTEPMLSFAEATASPPPHPSKTTHREEGSLIKHAASLEEQHQILSDMSRFYLKTQHIRLDTQKQTALRRQLMMTKLQQQKNKPPQA